MVLSDYFGLLKIFGGGSYYNNEIGLSIYNRALLQNRPKHRNG